MKRKFNDTGLCVPHRHYMVDISAKIEQIFELVEVSISQLIAPGSSVRQPPFLYS